MQRETQTVVDHPFTQFSPQMRNMRQAGTKPLEWRPKAIQIVFIWGRPGFDVGRETLGACRAADNS
jgi:hypothetical protein